MLRWGWRPGEFLAFEPRERAFVIAGLMLEKDMRSAKSVNAKPGRWGRI